MFAQKNLVAAAALLAIAGAAQAQVKVYGSVEAAFGSYERAGGSRVTKVESGDMMTSFLGFSGSEDLGGGLKAEFVLETFLKADTGDASAVYNKAGGFWSRGSNVALSGSFGKVALGQYDNPLFTSGYTYNPFGSSMTFSPTMRHFYYRQDGIGQSYATTGIDTGFVNSITYESPVVQGFGATLQFSPKESGTSNSYAASGSYNVGPVSATLTYVKSGVATAYDSNEKIFGLGVSYDLGVAKLFGQFTSIKDSSTATDNGATTTFNEGNEPNKSTIYQVGVSVPVTEKGTVLASFGKSSNKLTSNGDKETDTVFSVGYDYALSKRTDVYVVFSNNQHTNVDSGQTTAVGIKHNF